MRVFIGIPLPLEIQRAVWSQSRAIASNLSGFRWVDPENYHITLLFIGEVSPGELDSIKRRFETLVLPPAFSSELGLFDRLPLKKGPPRVLVASLAAGNEECKKLYRCVTKELGEYAERREYVPHVTLSRAMRNRRPGSHLNGVFDDPFRFSGAFEVTRIVLYSSQLSPQGARYAELMSRDLALRAEL